MHLHSMILTNFRRFEHEVIEFNNGINIFVGPNNSGKSTILEALGVILDFSSAQRPNRFSKDIDTGTCSVELIFTLNPQQWIDASKLLNPDRYVELTSSGMFGDPFDEHEFGVESSKALIKATWAQSFRDGRSTGDQKTLSFENMDSLEYSSQMNEQLGEQILRRLRGNSLRQFLNTISYLPIERRVQKNTENIIYYNDFANRQEDYHSVRNRIFHLKDKNPELYDDLKSKILEVFNYQDFDIQLNLDTGHLDMSIIRGESRFDINEMGAGTQSFILLFSHLYLSGLEVSIIDEPEINLHATLVKKLASFLKQLSDSTQFILTSHNEVFIKEYNLDEIYRVEYLDEERQSKVKKLNEPTDQDELLELLGFELSPIERGDTKFSNIMIFTEGPSDQKYIESIADKLNKTSDLLNAKPSYWALNGKHNLNRILNQTFIDTLNRIKMPFLLILDRDEDYEEEIKKIEEKIGEERLVYLSKREIENYFLVPDVILSCIRTQTSKKSEEIKQKVEELDTTQIKEKLWESASPLLRKTVLKRFIQNQFGFRLFEYEKMSEFIKENQDKTDREITHAIHSEYLTNITSLNPSQLEGELSRLRASMEEKWTHDTFLDICPAKDLMKEFNRYLLAEFEVDVGCTELLNECTEIHSELEDIIDRIISF